MTRERAKELLPVIQAFSDGKEVEFRLKNGSGFWGKVYNLPCADDCEYRIKPKPREWWFLEYSDGTRSDLIGNLEHAENRAVKFARGTKVIHVQEVE